MHVTLDASDRTTVWVCACGARGLAMSNLAAWTAARAHERRAHPGDDDTAQNRQKMARRALKQAK